VLQGCGADLLSRGAVAFGILDLTEERGVNMNGVRLILEMEAGSPPDAEKTTP